MADSSQAQPALAQELLARLPVDLTSLPKEVLARLEERARGPDRRLMVGRYVVAGELGRGGMGVVYDAWDPGIERRVAIKTIEPELVPEEDRDEVIERFKRETKIVGRLHHPGIVTIFDYGEERESPGAPLDSRLYYYVMEYLEGQSLARIMRERRMMPDVDAVQIVVDVLDALAVSHGAGVIHRDIKPSNIFLRGGTQAVLLDFGIAKTGSVALTRQGQILGTPSYLAPERLREKETPVDGRADIFSLGVLLFTMITGDAPFVGDDVYDVIDKIAKTAHPKLARSTPSGQALSRVLDRMLAKRPEDRYPNAGEAAGALRAVLVLLRATTPDVDDLFVQGVRMREELHDNAATEIATPSSALPSLSSLSSLSSSSDDDDEDTGRHSVTVAELERPPPSITPQEETALMGPAVSAETPAPVRVAELFGTRPDIALQRETRELERGSKPPPLPLRTSLLPKIDETFDDADISSEKTYDSHLAANDETTDDHTIADPEPPRPKNANIETAQIRPLGVPGLRAGKLATKSPSGGTPLAPLARTPQLRSPSRPAIEKQAEHVIRASNVEHSEQRTELEKSARPSVRPVKAAPPRNKRSRIEASLVDEDDVVVKPASLDALKPDEMPTQTGFRVPAPGERSIPPGSLPQAVDILPRVADPAERNERTEKTDRATERKDENLVDLKEDESGETPELDVPRSAAVARRTFGTGRAAPAQKSTKLPIHVRVTGNVGSAADRMRVVRRRGVMLLAAMLAAIAVGLLLGRIKQRTTNEPPKEQGGQPAVLEPRAMKALPETTQGEPAIVKPPPPAEILQEASAALAERKFEKAERLFDSAVRASPERSALRAQALLGHGDVLRQLGNKAQAIEVYRALLAESPRSVESENARVALQELGVEIIAPVKRQAPALPKPAPKEEGETKQPEAKPVEPKPAEKKPAELATQEISASMPPEEKCRLLMAKHLNDRSGAVKALTELSRQDPRIGCVYWHLGNSYKQMGDDRAALASFRRYLEVEPNTPRRAAVEQKIKDLANKLEER